MNSENDTNSREVRRAFWRGFGRGLGQSLSSPENSARVRTNARLAYASSLIGSVAALSWVKHLRAASAQPFSTSDQIAVLLTGAVGATAIVELCRWLWRRWNNAHAA